MYIVHYLLYSITTRVIKFSKWNDIDYQVKSQAGKVNHNLTITIRWRDKKKVNHEEINCLIREKQLTLIFTIFF